MISDVFEVDIFYHFQKTHRFLWFMSIIFDVVPLLLQFLELVFDQLLLLN